MRRGRPPYAERSDEPGPLVDLVIDHVGAQGDGVTADGVYAPLTLPDERVRARRVAGAGGVARAELQAVLAASPDRVAPPCPHFGACGGCALQHWAHPPYLAWKVDLIRQALARERIETQILAPFAAKPGTRRRLALHARRAGGRTVLGFKARRSWSVVDIAVCPIAEPALTAALEPLRSFAATLFEHPKSAPTLHVAQTLAGLDVDVTGVEARSGGLSASARSRAAEAARAGGFARATLAGEPVYQSRRPIVRFGRADVAIPPGGFLQAVAEAEAAMADFAGEALDGATRVADLFCGSGAFALRLAESASVLALDGSAPAVAALAAAAGTPGLKPIRAEARDLDRRPLLASEMRRLDGAVFDPPRAGALAQARQLAASGLARVVGVSCNPTSFARDARVLIDAGFRLTRVLPVDQFLWSPHIELVGVFER